MGKRISLLSYFRRESAIVDLSKASGLPLLVVYSYCVELIFQRSHFLEQAIHVCSHMVDLKDYMFRACDLEVSKSPTTPVCTAEVQNRILGDFAYPLYVYLDICLCLDKPNNLRHCIFIANKMLDNSKTFSQAQYTNVYQKIFMHFMATNKLFDLDRTNLKENPLFQFSTNSLPQGVDIFSSFYVSLGEDVRSATSVNDEAKYVENACTEAVCYLLKTKYDRENAVSKYEDLTSHSLEHFDEIQKRLDQSEKNPGSSGAPPKSFCLVPNDDKSRQVVDFVSFFTGLGWLENNMRPDTAPLPQVLYSEPIVAEGIEVDASNMAAEGHKEVEQAAEAVVDDSLEPNKAFADEIEDDPEEVVNSAEDHQKDPSAEQDFSPGSEEQGDEDGRYSENDEIAEDESRATNHSEQAASGHLEEQNYDAGKYVDNDAAEEEEEVNSRGSEGPEDVAASHPEIYELGDSDDEEGENEASSPTRHTPVGDVQSDRDYSDQDENVYQENMEDASSDGVADIEIVRIGDGAQPDDDDEQFPTEHYPNHEEAMDAHYESMQEQNEVTERDPMDVGENATSGVEQAVEGNVPEDPESPVFVDISMERAPSPEAGSTVEEVEVAVDPPEQQPVVLADSMDAGYEGGEENTNTYAGGRMSYDSASQEDTSNMAAIESAKNASMLSTKFEQRSEARSRQNFASDEGYEAEESQGHTEPEDDNEKPYTSKDNAEHSGYDAEESQEEEETRKGMPPPKDRADLADGYYPTGDESQQTGEESQHSDNEEGDRQTDELSAPAVRIEGDGYEATGEESQTEEPPQKKQNEALADGYYATAEDSQSQGGHTEEEDDPKVSEESKPMEVELEENKSTKDSRHVEFAQPTRPSSQNLDDPGYMPDGHWTEDEAKGKKVTLTRSKKQEGYLAGESSGGEEKNPTDLDDEESRRQDRHMEAPVPNRPVQQRSVPADSQSISGMSAADDTMAGIHDEEGESSDEDDLDMDQRKVEEQPNIPALQSSQGNTLQDFAAQAQGAQKPQSDAQTKSEKQHHDDGHSEGEEGKDDSTPTVDPAEQDQKLEIIVEESEDLVDNDGALVDVEAEDQMHDKEDDDPVPGEFRSPSKQEDKSGIGFDVDKNGEKPADQYSDSDEENPAPVEYRSPSKPKGDIDFDDIDENAGKPAIQYSDSDEENPAPQQYKSPSKSKGDIEFDDIDENAEKNSDDADDKEMEIESRDNAMDIDEGAEGSTEMQLSPNDSNDGKEKMEVDIQEAQMEVDEIREEPESKHRQDTEMMDDHDAEMERADADPVQGDLIEVEIEDNNMTHENIPKPDKLAEDSFVDNDDKSDSNQIEEAALNAAESLAALQKSPEKGEKDPKEIREDDQIAKASDESVDGAASETKAEPGMDDKTEEPLERLAALDPIPEDDVVESEPVAPIRNRSARNKDAALDGQSPSKPRTRRSTRSKARAKTDDESVSSAASMKTEEIPSDHDAPAPKRRTRRTVMSAAESEDESVVSTAGKKIRRSSRLAQKSDDASVASGISEDTTKSKRTQTRKGRAKKAHADEELSDLASDEESVASSQPQRNTAKKAKTKRTRKGAQSKDDDADDDKSVASTSSKRSTRQSGTQQAEPIRRSTRARKPRSYS